MENLTSKKKIEKPAPRNSLVTHWRDLLGSALSERAKPQVAQFKTAVWQSPRIAEAFMKGSDASEKPAAAMMDAVVNGFFLEQCPPKSKVLDVGCGHGVVSIFLARHGHSVTACDVSEPLLKSLEQEAAGLNIEIRKGDAHHIPASDGEFDVIVARMFLGHFPNWQDIVREMARCCRRGGRLVIHFTSRENADLGIESGWFDCTFVDSPDLDQREVDPSRYFAASHESEIKEMCSELGLRMLDRAPATFFLHNRIFGHCLGQERFDAYQKELLKRFKDVNVREFAVWFEQTVVRHLPVWASYYNILVLEKPS